jgi:hypothetical protein
LAQEGTPLAGVLLMMYQVVALVIIGLALGLFVRSFWRAPFTRYLDGNSDEPPWFGGDGGGYPPR